MKYLFTILVVSWIINVYVFCERIDALTRALESGNATVRAAWNTIDRIQGDPNELPTTGWHALNGGPCRCPPGKCQFEENREFQFFPTNPPQVISDAMYDKSRGVKWGDGYLYPLKKRSAQ